MNHILEKKIYEMNIFTLFVESSGFKKVINMNSIESCDPPRPDILCKTYDMREFYFELVEILDSGIAQNAKEVTIFNKLMKNCLNNLSHDKRYKFDKMYSNASFGFTFMILQDKNY